MPNNLPMVRRTFLGMSGAAALAAQTSTTSNASSIKVEKDVVVGKGGDTELHCDIYRPNGQRWQSAGGRCRANWHWPAPSGYGSPRPRFAKAISPPRSGDIAR